jgi:hypothetical protein
VSTVDPGVYVDMSWADYERIDAINWSVLKHILRSPAHMREEQVHPSVPTAALDFGSAFHSAILEPGDFAKLYAPAPSECDRRTKEGKAKWAEVEKMNPGATILKPEDWDAITSMRDAVYAHKTASAFLKGKGKNEVVFVWQDTEFGCMCKARVDRLTEWEGWSFIVDAKSCRDASAWAFARDCAALGYHKQKAFYLRGAAALSPHNRRFAFIAVEKERPFGVAVYELDEDAEMAANSAVRAALSKYVQCVKNNSWPVYEPGLWPLRLPMWANSAVSEIGEL